MLSPLPRHSDGRSCLAHPLRRISLPRKGRRVGLCIDLFEAYSAFTHVTACTLVLPPEFVARYIEGFSHFVTSMTAPITSGWSISPGGAFTHWKAPPLHGAHPLRSVAEARSRRSRGRNLYRLNAQFTGALFSVRWNCLLCDLHCTDRHLSHRMRCSMPLWQQIRRPPQSVGISPSKRDIQTLSYDSRDLFFYYLGVKIWILRFIKEPVAFHLP